MCPQHTIPACIMLTISALFPFRPFQVQSRAFADIGKACLRPSQNKHLRFGGQFGRAEVVPVQSAFDEQRGDQFGAAEGPHQFAAHRLHAVQVFAAARRNGGRDHPRNRAFGRHFGEVRLRAVLVASAAVARVGGRRDRFLWFGAQVRVQRHRHHIPDHFAGVFDPVVGRHWRWFWSFHDWIQLLQAKRIFGQKKRN